MVEVARVAIDVPVDSLFDYDTTGVFVCVGTLVIVPFRRRRVIAVVVELANKSNLPTHKLKKVEQSLSLNFFNPEGLSLLKFCAHYYHHPIGQTILGILPAKFRKIPNSTLLSYKVTDLGKRERLGKINSQSEKVLKLMNEILLGDPIRLNRARKIYPRATEKFKIWEEKGWIKSFFWISSDSLDCKRKNIKKERVEKINLSFEQKKVVDTICPKIKEYGVWLLQGVTGSGKTEVYMSLIEKVTNAGGQVVVLVPEINLTPQLEEKFFKRFPNLRITSLHSGIAQSERYTRWLESHDGLVDILLGTRMAIFASLPKLGLIVVDEEHDSSYKQQDGLRYNARDIAIYKARLEGVPVVLGSATPALESYRKAIRKNYYLLKLVSRPSGQSVKVRIIDTSNRWLDEGFSEELLKAIQVRLEKGEQSLLYINRRGFAPVLYCGSCGWSAECLRCSAKLTYHRSGSCLKCHYCGHQEKVIAQCRNCGNHELKDVGAGTQRIEASIKNFFPKARVIRVDSDSTKSKGSFDQIRQSILKNKVDILVGTQMMSKGHDFPKLTLVGVLDADMGIYSSDFRASERLFQRLMQVSGRTGRDELPGEVIVQTGFPENPLYKAVSEQRYEAASEMLLSERKSAGFPPFVHQAVLRVDGLRRQSIDKFLEEATFLANHYSEKVDVFDPVEAPIAKVASRHRAQLLVQAHSRTALQKFLKIWHRRLNKIETKSIRWALDVDPMEI